MKVEVLGFWGGYPFNGGATAGYLVSTEEGHILLDCGSGVLSKLSERMPPEKLSAVVLSHLHHDHMTDLGVLQYALVGALRNGRIRQKLPIYAPSEPVELYHKIKSGQTETLVIDEEKEHRIGNLKIEYLPVRHTIPAFAIRITYKEKVLVYSSDSEYLGELAEFAAGADLFICEATICEGSVHTIGAGHMDARQAGKLAARGKVKRLLITHLPHDGDFELMKRQAKEAFGGDTLIASSNMVIEL